MGDPKIVKKKFEAPPHPWQKSRIEEEKQLKKEFGLKNKGEIWKIGSKAKNFANQAKRLTVLDTPQSRKEKEQLLTRLFRLGLLPKGADIGDVLSITVKDMLERRLQTIVYKKGMARSIGQARQFITHRHISVNGKIVTAPSYFVLASDEESTTFIAGSALANEEHPERVIEKAKPKPKKPKKESKPGKKEEKKEEKPKAEKKKEEAPKAEEKKPAEEKKAEKKEEPKSQSPEKPKEEKVKQ